MCKLYTETPGFIVDFMLDGHAQWLMMLILIRERKMPSESTDVILLWREGRDHGTPKWSRTRYCYTIMIYTPLANPKFKIYLVIKHSYILYYFIITLFYTLPFILYIYIYISCPHLNVKSYVTNKCNFSILSRPILSILKVISTNIFQIINANILCR